MPLSVSLFLLFGKCRLPHYNLTTPAKLDCPPSTKVWLIISSTSCHLSKVSFPNPLAPGRCLSVGEPHCLSTTDIFAVVVCFLFCFVCFFWPSIHACVTLWLAYIWGFADPALLSVLPELKMVEAAYQASGYCPHVTVLVFTCLWEFCFLTKKMSRCGSGLRLVKSLKKKSENVMQKYIETKSNIINHQLSNYFGLSSGATPWIFTKLHNCKTFYLIRFQHRRKHYQRHYGPRRWLLWPLILVW